MRFFTALSPLFVVVGAVKNTLTLNNSEAELFLSRRGASPGAPSSFRTKFGRNSDRFPTIPLRLPYGIRTEFGRNSDRFPTESIRSSYERWIMMFAYFAFKGLYVDGDGDLFSPRMFRQWHLQQTPWGEYPGLRARSRDLEDGYGVFAGTYTEALDYSDDIYLVFPDPRCSVVIGESGWRAERAFVYYKVNDIDETARLIYAAHVAGYPQIKEILIWAGMRIGVSEVMQEFAAAAEAVRTACVKHAERLDVRGCFEDIWFRYVECIVERAAPYIIELWSYLTYDSKLRVMHWVRHRRVNPADIPQLIDLFVVDPDEGIRAAVARDTVFYDDETALRVLRTLLSSSELRVQHAIVEACRVLGESTLPILRELAENAKDQHLILCILDVCHKIGPRSRDIVTLYLAHPSRWMREYAQRLIVSFDAKEHGSKEKY